MSIEDSVVLGCPVCQRTKTVVVWQSLNADVSPEAREELLKGKINVFECEVCEQTFPIAAPLLYHDMTRRFLVQFHPFEVIEDPDFLARFDRDGRDTRFLEPAGIMPAVDGLGYMKNPHVVFSMAELVRYVLFRERLFDSRAEPDRFFVAGFPYHEGPRLIDRLTAGDPLRLVREPDNPHDPRAVAIYNQDDRIGYVPRERNREIADRLDGGVSLDCRITAIDPEEGTYEAIEVMVALPFESI
jgi:CpXC protein/HIRAN domain